MLDKPFLSYANGIVGMGYTVTDKNGKVVSYFGEDHYYTGDPSSAMGIGKLEKHKYPENIREIEGWKTNVTHGDTVNPPLIFAIDELEDEIRDQGYLENDYAPQWMGMYELGLNETYVVSTGIQGLDIMTLRVPGGWVYYTVSFQAAIDSQTPAKFEILASPVFVPFSPEFQATSSDSE